MPDPKHGDQEIPAMTDFTDPRALLRTALLLCQIAAGEVATVADMKLLAKRTVAPLSAMVRELDAKSDEHYATVNMIHGLLEEDGFPLVLNISFERVREQLAEATRIKGAAKTYTDEAIGHALEIVMDDPETHRQRSALIDDIARRATNVLIGKKA